jgi:hypothetical protein
MIIWSQFDILVVIRLLDDPVDVRWRVVSPVPRQRGTISQVRETYSFVTNRLTNSGRI